MDILSSFFSLGLSQQLFIGLQIIILSILQGFALSWKKIWVKLYILVGSHVLLIVYLKYFAAISIDVYLFYFIFSLPLTLILWVLFSKESEDNSKVDIDLIPGDIWKLVFPIQKSTKLVYQNIKRGIAVLGSAGSGKSESVYVPIIKHCAFHNFAGINLDYKDGELTEIVNYFYTKHRDVPSYKEGVPRVEVRNLCLHRPEMSDFINPIDPIYLHNQDDVYLVLNTLFAYNKQTEGRYDFFENAPQSCIGGVIWRLKEDYPDYCSLPYAIAICLEKDALELAEFISDSIQARVIGSAFLKSFGVDDKGNFKVGEQMTGIMGSMADILRQYASPNMFYVLQRNSFPLELNDSKRPILLNVINSPKYDTVYSPFYSMCIAMIINQMSERDRWHSMLLMDEGATTKIPKFYKIPSTRRSYDIATVYGVQDKVISDLTYSDKETKGILANLSYMLIGKANDPESVKYYKSLLEEVKEKTKTVSRSDGFMFEVGNKRISEGERETSKFKNQDISGLGIGEFVSYADGVSNKIKFKLLNFERIKSKPKRTVTKFDIEENYKKIFNSVDSFV